MDPLGIIVFGLVHTKPINGVEPSFRLPEVRKVCDYDVGLRGSRVTTAMSSIHFNHAKKLKKAIVYFSQTGSCLYTASTPPDPRKVDCHHLALSHWFFYLCHQTVAIVSFLPTLQILKSRPQSPNPKTRFQALNAASQQRLGTAGDCVSYGIILQVPSERSLQGFHDCLRLPRKCP